MRAKQYRKTMVAFSVVLLHVTVARAQDSHYWTQQYGARAELLGGIAVGSQLDISSTFYNPGALVLIDSAEYLQAAEPFQIQNIVVEGGAVSGEDLSNLSLRGAPSLFAGSLPFEWWGGRAAYSVLTRHEFKFDVKSRAGTTLDSPDGPVSLVGESTLRQDLSELWAGLTWSKLLSDRIGLGLTQYFTYRGQNSRSQALVQAAINGGSGSSAALIDDFDFWTLGLVWKFGISFDYKPMSFGFSLTTPDVDFYGTGKAFFNRNVTNVDTGNGRESVIATSYVEGLKPSHNSPLSLAAGWAYRFRRSAIHLGTEWFASIPRYVVMDAGFSEVVGGARLSGRLTEELGSVLNAGVGIEHTFNERVSYFGSFRTDFTAHVPSSDANLSLTKWDLYHISSGAKVGFMGVDFTLGLTYAFGRDDVATPFNLSNVSPREPLGGPSQVRVRYQSFRILFGFAFMKT